MNAALYKREMKGSLRLLLILAAIITLYVAVIIGMYDSSLMAMLDSFTRIMPQLMAAVGMTAGATSLAGFMVSYLYGLVLVIFPMVFCILRAHGLIARYVDNGSMVALIAAPVKRRAVALTQAAVLVSGILLMVVYATALEFICASAMFPGELSASTLLELNGGLACLMLFIGGVCFLCSCAFSDARYSLGFGAGIPTLMFVLQMLGNMGGAAQKAKYLTFFTLFNPSGIAAGSSGALAGSLVLLVGAAGLYALAVTIFCKKDLPI